MARSSLTALVAFALVLLSVPLGALPAEAASTEVFFSEYIEGSSNNKALEIYNGTGAAIDLAAGGYNVQMCFNGNPTCALTINLAGTVAAGDVFVLAHAAANATILAQADQTNGSGWFNGDDAVVLRKGTTAIDVIGQVGFDPGTEWGTGLTSTADNTLRRKIGIVAGDSNGADAFDPAVEWDGFAQDSFARLGAHPGEPAPVVASTSPTSGATGVAADSNISITFSEPVTVSGSWFAIACASGPREAIVSGGPMTFMLDPTANFTSNDSCTVRVLATGVTDQDGEDPPDNMARDHAFTFQTGGVFTCGEPATRVHAVQGSGLASPMVGSTVTLEGVVVGDYQKQPSEFGGFYLQEESADADGDALTSEGIFVFDGGFGVDVSPGEVVRVRGTVTEFFSLTEVTSVNAVLVCSGGATIPATGVSLPVANVTDLERYEGMLVNFAQTLTATEVFNLGRFGEVSLSGAGRLYTPTAITTPGAAAIAQLAQNNRSRIILDDGNSQQNIDPTRYPQGGLSATNTLRVGDTLAGLTGVMDFRFNNYRIQPVGPISFDHVNLRTVAPDPVDGNLKVASFNVLNFFNGDGLGGGFPTARGANTLVELQRQLAKEVSALSAIDADIVGLMEIENDAQPNSALAELVAALNVAMGAGTYAFIDTGVIGTDAIKVALIYKPRAVMPVGGHHILDSGVDPRFIDTLNRPALAQTFDHVATGQSLTVVVNHLKSKGSSCASVGDPDTGDGQGNCNQTRTAAAEALADWIASDPTGSGDPDVLMIGDLNSYTFEDPITTLANAGLVNLVREFGGLSPYSYVFSGESGYLDHALATSPMASQVTGVTEWHINPDEPTVLDYNLEFKSTNHQTTLYDDGPYRSSDHDPVIVGLQLLPVARMTATVEGTPTWAGGIRTKVNISGMSGDVQGRVLVEGASLSYEATRIDSLVAMGYDATIYGAFGTVQFRLDIHDGRGGGGDTLRLRTSDGYDSGVLRDPRGQIVVNVR